MHNPILAKHHLLTLFAISHECTNLRTNEEFKTYSSSLISELVAKIS